MNNNGWSLNEFLLGIGILTFSLILSVIIFDVKVKSSLPNNKKYKNENSYTYEEMEEELVKATMKYIEKNYDKTPDSRIKISMDTLVDSDLYYMEKDPKYKNYKCDGYVIFNKNKNSFSYKPYLKCKNYETGNFNNN